jgi:hypothetical protein
VSETPRTTPGPLGYLGAVLVSIGVTASGIAVSYAPESGLLAGLWVFVLAAVYSTIAALGAAPVGVLLVHLTCRKVTAQWVHVAVAGLSGVLTGLVFAVWTGDGIEWGYAGYWAGLLGLATAVGRAAVIPARRVPQP